MVDAQAADAEPSRGPRNRGGGGSGAGAANRLGVLLASQGIYGYDSLDSARESERSSDDDMDDDDDDDEEGHDDDLRRAIALSRAIWEVR